MPVPKGDIMTIDEIKRELKKILKPGRFNHTIGVMNTSVKLAQTYGADESKAAMAGLLHDCAREIKGEVLFELCERYHIPVDDVCRTQPELLHGPLGSKLSEEVYGVSDREVLDAVCYHTTGRENMSLLEKIVFVADIIEPSRNFKGVDEIRKDAFVDLDKAVLAALDGSIRYVLSKGALLHIDTVNSRNYLINEINKRW